MAPSATLAAAMGLAVGASDLVQSTFALILNLSLKRCRNCAEMVKKSEYLQHLEEHLERDEKQYADDKAVLERRIEIMSELEKRLRVEKAELQDRLLTITTDKLLLSKEKEDLKIELEQAKHLALSTLEYTCPVCGKAVPVLDRDSHVQIHRYSCHDLSYLTLLTFLGSICVGCNCQTSLSFLLGINNGQSLADELDK